MEPVWIISIPASLSHPRDYNTILNTRYMVHTEGLSFQEKLAFD